MSQNFKLSLPVAILINVNIMLGTGVFINTVELAKRAGALGFLSYLIVGILMLPLIASFATLMKIYPQGGFYAFAQKELGPLAGFVSAWSYFIAKMASASWTFSTPSARWVRLRFLSISISHGSHEPRYPPNRLF